MVPDFLSKKKGKPKGQRISQFRKNANLYHKKLKKNNKKNLTFFFKKIWKNFNFF